MKCIGARWLVKLHKHLEQPPHCKINDIRHAGIFKVLNILTDVDDSKLVE